MVYVKLDQSGVVIDKECAPKDGYEAAPDTVICGQVKQVDGSFATPAPSQQYLNDKQLSAAHTAFLVSDNTAIRCFKAGVPFPQTWQDYVVALRALVAAGGAGDMPTQPSFPPNT